MTNILVLSPHLDDAAFSIGPLLAKIKNKYKIIVGTAFTKTELTLTDFALACQLDKGLSKEVDYMALRRKEDIDWSNTIGAEAVHGLLAEAPHRGYNTAQSLFGSIQSKDDIEIRLVMWLKQLMITHDPMLILCPLAVGHHVDHVWVKNMVTKINKYKIPIFFFKDQPYASTLLRFNEHDYLIDDDEWYEVMANVSKVEATMALKAAKAYVSQIQFQFKNDCLMDQTLLNAWKNSIPLYHSHKLTESCKSFISFLSN